MSQSLALKFELASGDTRTLSFSDPKEDLTESDVATAMDTIVTVGDTFVDAPVAPLQAVLTTTEKTILYDNT